MKKKEIREKGREKRERTNEKKKRKKEERRKRKETIEKRKSKEERRKTRENEKIENKKEEKRKRTGKFAFVKGVSFFLWPQYPKRFAVIVDSENKHQAASWPSALPIGGKEVLS